MGFMVALRAACLKLRKERENSPSWAAKRTTLVKSTNSDNNNNNKSKLLMLDLSLTLNGLSLYLDDWAGPLPSHGEGCLQEFIACEKMCSALSSAHLFLH